MKTSKLIIPLSILALLLVAAGSFLWANGMMDALMAYRSPLADSPPAPGEPMDSPLTRRVVIILVDALRLDTSLDPQVMPTLQTLRQQGAWATMHSRPPSYSAPGYTTLLTGAWPEINDSQLINPPDNNHVRAFTQDDIFAAADRAGYQTAVSGYTWFEGLLANSGVDAGFYTPGEDHDADLAVVAAAQPWLASGDYELVLVHLDQVDYAGHHEGGPRDPRWDAAAARVDSLIQELVATLDLEKDTLLVLSDHGQIERGGHGGQDPVTLMEPFILVGAGIQPGAYPDIRMVDVAPTVAALLGTSLPASNQGEVLSKMFDQCPGAMACIYDAQLVQKSNLLTAYQDATGVEIPQNPPLEITGDYLVAMDSAKTERLARERIPRGILALVAALLPAALLIRARGKRLAWLLGGALLYAAVFNLVYALAAHKTYSLSSVVSANDLILSTAVYAGIGLSLGWLFVLLGRRLTSPTPAEAARTTLALVFLVLYLLALGVLWHLYRNGPALTWTLPEFGPMFLAFLSLVQALFVSAIGLVLTGVTALVAWLRAR